MAAGDLADLRSRVRNRGSFSANDAGLTDAVILTFINAALKQIAAEHDWPWLETSATITTVIGTQSYTPTAGWVRTTSIVNTTTGSPLDERPIEELDSFTANGTPAFFADYGDSIILAPTPDAVATFKHRFVQTESTLSADADLPKIPRAFDEGVVEWATMLAWDFARQYDKAGECATRYNTWLQTTQDILNRTKRPRRVHVRAGAGTLADLDDRLLARGGFDPTSIEMSHTARKSFLNEAIKKIANERDWPWLFTTATLTTVQGTATYTFPANYIRTDSIFEPSTGVLLLERQIQELDALVSQGRPVLYTEYAGNIVLGPIPDGVYTLTHRYVRSETALAAQTDSPLIPNALDDGAVEWAAKLAFDLLGDAANAKEAGERYSNWLEQTYDNVRRGRRPLRVRVRAGSII